MTSKYYPPTYEEDGFHCPYCQVYSKQKWLKIYFLEATYYYLEDLKMSVCSHCRKFAYWYKGEMIVPDESTAPLPHEDLPENIKEDYLEARSIVNKSPRGSAAILRLCLQKLMKELGETGKNINTDIGLLVKKGLPEEVQQALDILRVIGNESVHPGELDMRDDIDTAIQLFELINFIVEDRITRKKKIFSLFSRLPENKRQEIERRDE
ncbi:MAG: DUF4145 domain-containing protein [Bacteroidaceae bacterium]|nr:DUF4145 domain-containing protein [Bacteroidaceae bacterium]